MLDGTNSVDVSNPVGTTLRPRIAAGFPTDSKRHGFQRVGGHSRISRSSATTFGGRNLFGGNARRFDGAESFPTRLGSRGVTQTEPGISAATVFRGSGRPGGRSNRSPCGP